MKSFKNFNKDLWINDSLTIDDKIVDYQIKRFDTDSTFGINDGKISKMFVYLDDKTIIEYDREWITKPKTDFDKKVLDILLKKYN